MKKKAMSLLLAAAMTATLFAGCGSDNGEHLTIPQQETTL